MRKGYLVRLFELVLVVALFGAAGAGCGTNKFQRELETEDAAIKLTEETLEGKYELISTAELKSLLDDSAELVLVDAMPAEASYNKGHIAGAVNFEFPKEVIEDWDESTMGDRTQAEYAGLLGEDKQQRIVVYCGFVKCARSHNAAVFARELGYSNVIRYPGGIHAWRGAGYALTSD